MPALPRACWPSSLPNLSFPPRPAFRLILDRLRDPSNLGTLLHTALAAGVAPDEDLLRPIEEILRGRR